MPELPEVETIRRDLVKKILCQKIIAVEVRLPRLVRGGVKEFKQVLINNTFTDINRIGKLMVFSLKQGNKQILLHLKMTGQLIYCQDRKVIAGGHSLPKLQGGLPSKHSRIIFTFSDGSQLFFNDMRTFGYTELADKERVENIRKKYGQEPLSRNFTEKVLHGIIRGRKVRVKAILLDQALIAGIGNIYADEILFAAKVRPDRRANTLKKAEIARIYKAIKVILRKAIKCRGTTFNDYVDASGNQGNFIKLLKVYGREKKKCLECRTGVIKKIKLAGRGTRYCPQCQR